MPTTHLLLRNLPARFRHLKSLHTALFTINKFNKAKGNITIFNDVRECIERICKRTVNLEDLEILNYFKAFSKINKEISKVNNKQIKWSFEIREFDIVKAINRYVTVEYENGEYNTIDDCIKKVVLPRKELFMRKLLLKEKNSKIEGNKNESNNNEGNKIEGNKNESSEIKYSDLKACNLTTNINTAESNTININNMKDSITNNNIAKDYNNTAKCLDHSIILKHSIPTQEIGVNENNSTLKCIDQSLIFKHLIPRKGNDSNECIKESSISSLNDLEGLNSINNDNNPLITKNALTKTQLILQRIREKEKMRQEEFIRIEKLNDYILDIKNAIDNLFEMENKKSLKLENIIKQLGIVKGKINIMKMCERFEAYEIRIYYGEVYLYRK